MTGEPSVAYFGGVVNTLRHCNRATAITEDCCVVDSDARHGPLLAFVLIDVVAVTAASIGYAIGDQRGAVLTLVIASPLAALFAMGFVRYRIVVEPEHLRAEFSVWRWCLSRRELALAEIGELQIKRCKDSQIEEVAKSVFGMFATLSSGIEYPLCYHHDRNALMRLRDRITEALRRNRVHQY